MRTLSDAPEHLRLKNVRVPSHRPKARLTRAATSRHEPLALKAAQSLSNVLPPIAHPQFFRIRSAFFETAVEYAGARRGISASPCIRTGKAPHIIAPETNSVRTTALAAPKHRKSVRSPSESPQPFPRPEPPILKRRKPSPLTRRISRRSTHPARKHHFRITRASPLPSARALTDSAAATGTRAIISPPRSTRT